MSRWTVLDAPRQDGRVAVVTGASSGLGEETALALAGLGAHVLIAARDPLRAAASAARVRTAHPDASVEAVPLDLADLASVAACAELVGARHPRIDLVVANAGVMATPRARTADGFELQFGVNHLGHHAFVAALLPRLAPDGRIVVVSSSVHRLGGLDLDDLGWERRRYRPWGAYAASKLANLLFAAELARRLAATGSRVGAVAAHPGFAATRLQESGPRMRGGLSARVVAPLAAATTRVVAQSAARGALPQLRAALDPDVPSGSYWGPDGLGAMRGWPTLEVPSDAARDLDLAAGLWEASERLTGVRTGLAG